MKLYQAIAENGEWNPPEDSEWVYEKRTRMQKYEEQLPHGSGIDDGCKIEEAGKNKIVITFDYHYMDENGFYDGWGSYRVTVRPWMRRNGIYLTISGKDYHGLKEYLYELFYHVLEMEVE